MISRLSLFYSSPDLPRASDFYAAALGVEFRQRRHQEQTNYACAQLADGVVLELWPAGGERPSRVQLEFTVSDLNTAAGRIIADGFEVRQLSGAVLTIDPAGNTVALTAE